MKGCKTQNGICRPLFSRARIWKSWSHQKGVIFPEIVLVPACRALATAVWGALFSPENEAARQIYVVGHPFLQNSSPSQLKPKKWEPGDVVNWITMPNVSKWQPWSRMRPHSICRTNMGQKGTCKGNWGAYSSTTDCPACVLGVCWMCSCISSPGGCGIILMISGAPNSPLWIETLTRMQ